jgi:hypothetical protein
MSVPQPSTSRARTQSRKKLNDDAAYFAPSGSAASKRQAVDKADGEPRTKRKRVDGNVAAHAKKDGLELENRKSLVSACDLTRL